MSGVTVYDRPRRNAVVQVRPHDYLYDSAFIVSGAKDYARASFRAAMASAQMNIQPVYRTMFSELRKFPRAHIVYYPNCRLPDHVDRSYGGYLARLQARGDMPLPHLTGKDRFKFAALPKKVLPLSSATPDFHPPTPVPRHTGPNKPRNRATQSLYRESSAQTLPWQPEGKAAEECENTPEVLYLDKLEWGPGKPYRTGNLPADFHTTEIINKMRHARTWNELVEGPRLPRWMKKRGAIISDVETKDWIFREAEIDELQDIRLELLHRQQAIDRGKQNSRSSRKLAKLWECKKSDMMRKIENIRHTRDRELRKLAAIHSSGGRVGQVAKMRAMRGHGSMTAAAKDPTSDLYAPLARHGYQARRRHAEIVYDPAFLSLEDHRQCSQPPAWLQECGQNLKKTCSGHHLPRDHTQLCERETKWSEQFLERLHNELIKARLGAATATAGPLRVLKPRRVFVEPRPTTPEVDAVDDEHEHSHQAALLLQRLIRGRAVQTLMYEGRTRAAELTEELKTTHGLQKEDRARIAKEEAKAREYTAIRTEAEQKEDAICALVDELCGGAVSAALDFLEKELRRLKEERRQHAFILIALREKAMREAAEAGRRQKEIHRLREHDEMFKQILGVTQETVEAYLTEIIQDGVELAAEEDANERARAQADQTDARIYEIGSMSTAEQHETVAELVQQFLLPEAHRQAARLRISALQNARAEAARDTIFGLLDKAEIKEKLCIRCGVPLGELCRCLVCPFEVEPTETTSRDDPRWQHSRTRPVIPEKTAGEKYPPQHEFRCMLNVLVDEVVSIAREQALARELVRRDVGQEMRMEVDEHIEAKEIVKLKVGKNLGKRLVLATGDPRAGSYFAQRLSLSIQSGNAASIMGTLPHVDILDGVRHDVGLEMMMQVDKHIEVKEIVELIVDRATGVLPPPMRLPTYHHYSLRHVHDAMARTQPVNKRPCPLELPSELRRRAEEEREEEPGCFCAEEEQSKEPGGKVAFAERTTSAAVDPKTLLPSALRELEEMRRCKCDTDEPSLEEVTTDTEYSSGVVIGGLEAVETEEIPEADM